MNHDWASKALVGVPQVLRAELFDRKPFVSLFPGRVGSIKLMKYSPESPLLRDCPKQYLVALLLELGGF